MPLPRPLNLPRQVRQRGQTGAQVSGDGGLEEGEALVVAGGLGVEEEGEGGVGSGRFAPDAEVVLGFFEGGGGGVEDLFGSGEVGEGERG